MVLYRTKRMGFQVRAIVEGTAAGRDSSEAWSSFRVQRMQCVGVHHYSIGVCQRGVLAPELADVASTFRDGVSFHEGIKAEETKAPQL